MGIFAILEEECIVPKATDQTFLAKLHKNHDGKHKSYGKPGVKVKKADFLLHHYAGTVPYSVQNWLEKNKDPINQSVAQLFAKATNALLSHCFQDYNPDGEYITFSSSFVSVLQHKVYFTFFLK